MFGAAHRVDLDTPPLKGNCRGTLVSPQIPMKTGVLSRCGISRDTAVPYREPWQEYKQRKKEAMKATAAKDAAKQKRR